MPSDMSAQFQSISPRPVFESICEQIRQLLLTGALKPGDKLPPERELAVRLKVSRPVLRDALWSLADGGIVEIRRGAKGGAFIREADPRRLSRSLEDLVYLGYVSLDELSEARLLVGDAVVRMASARASEADLLKLQAQIDRIEQLTRSSAAITDRVEASVEFLRLLAKSTGNRAMTLLMDSLIDILLNVYRFHDVGAIPSQTAARKRLVDALAARDADQAARQMRLILTSVHSALANAHAPQSS